MLNKKIVAASVAAFFAANVNAAVTFPDVDVAQETLPALVEGAFVLTPGVVTTEVGFSINSGSTRFVRYDLTNATFATIPDPAIVLTGAATIAVSVSSGGVGEDFVVLEVSASVADIEQDDEFSITATYNASGSATSAIKYSLFETGTAAVTEGGVSLASDTGNLASVASGMTGDAGTVGNLIALVEDQFTKFTGNSATGSLGSVDAADAVATGFVTPDTTTFDATLIEDGAATVTFGGDFTFGSWSYNTAVWTFDEDGEFDGTNATLNDDGTVEVAYVAGQTLDVDTTNGMAFDTAVKGSYSYDLQDIAFTAPAAGSFDEQGTIGSIAFDTTSIEMPYVTTFDGYNQRIIINNTGADANYTITFDSEAGVTPVPGSAAEGVLKGGEITVLRVADIVSFTGGSRGAATMEVEANASDVSAVSQIVNRGTAGTDTTVLN